MTTYKYWHYYFTQPNYYYCKKLMIAAGCGHRYKIE